MQLKSLEIHRQKSYEANPGKLMGTVEFENPQGSLGIGLDEKACREILNVCAKGLVAHASTIAEGMTADIIEGTQRLEHRVVE